MILKSFLLIFLCFYATTLLKNMRIFYSSHMMFDIFQAGEMYKYDLNLGFMQMTLKVMQKTYKP
jgi:hypothetical protein